MSKLPLLKELGIDCIWFAPIYKSPQVDNGYDVSDYRDIESAYGTLDDFKKVLDMAHSLGIRIIMDMVLNHTSDEHKWFVESRKSKDNPYRSYYIWQPPKADGSEPNNWGNIFREGNGSAWEFDENTGEYYLHQYSKKMPDLNWEYEPLRREIYDMLHWWLDMGVDGFRLDIFTRLKKPSGFPDNTNAPNPELDVNGYILNGNMCTNIEGIHDIIHGLNKNVFGIRNCMTVGEGAGVTYNNAVDYVKAEREEIDMVYHFQLAARKNPPFTADAFRRVQNGWMKVIENNGWAVQYLSNHDSQRQVSHYGDDTLYRKESAKALATLILTTPGTPFLYQGEEIGMVNVAFDDISDYNCCNTVGEYNSLVANGMPPKEALEFIKPRSRDNARTPYQWNDRENAGFSSGKPWLKVNPLYKEINLESDRKDKNSVFEFYKKAIALRKEYKALVYGDLTFYYNDSKEIIAYTRKYEDEELLITVNYSSKKTVFAFPEVLNDKKWKMILANREDIPCSLDGKIDLMPWTAFVFKAE